MSRLITFPSASKSNTTSSAISSVFALLASFRLIECVCIQVIMELHRVFLCSRFKKLRSKKALWIVSPSSRVTTLNTPPPISGTITQKVLLQRWIIERTFAWWNQYRRLSKDYELLPEISKAIIYGAMIHTMLRRLAKLKKQASLLFRNSL